MIGGELQVKLDVEPGTSGRDGAGRPGRPRRRVGGGDDGGPRRLAPCPASPNCVSSHAARARQRVAPIGYPGSRERARAELLAALRALPRTEVVHNEPDYVHATQRSRWLGFADDLEFELPGHERLIHVRSASRTGYYDFGVNRSRVDRLRRELNRRLVQRGL